MELNFNNKGYFRLPIFGDFSITINDTLIGTWIVGGFLIILAIIVRIKLKKFKDVPETKFQNVVELIVESMNNFVVSTMGENFAYMGNWFFGVFAFIICSNLSGLFGIRPPTADLATTLSFGITTFILINFIGITKSKSKFFKEFFEPVFVFFPINIISELATPISLSFRLFGNILGGTIIMGLVYGLFPWFLRLGIPAVLHIYFDAFVGSLQAYIFTVLSMSFIRNKAPK